MTVNPASGRVEEVQGHPSSQPGAPPSSSMSGDLEVEPRPGEDPADDEGVVSGEVEGVTGVASRARAPTTSAGSTTVSKAKGKASKKTPKKKRTSATATKAATTSKKKAQRKSAPAKKTKAKGSGKKATTTTTSSTTTGKGGPAKVPRLITPETVAKAKERLERRNAAKRQAAGSEEHPIELTDDTPDWKVQQDITRRLGKEFLNNEAGLMQLLAVVEMSTGNLAIKRDVERRMKVVEGLTIPYKTPSETTSSSASVASSSTSMAHSDDGGSDSLRDRRGTARGRGRTPDRTREPRGRSPSPGRGWGARSSRPRSRSREGRLARAERRPWAIGSSWDHSRSRSPPPRNRSPPRNDFSPPRRDRRDTRDRGGDDYRRRGDGRRDDRREGRRDDRDYTRNNDRDDWREYDSPYAGVGSPEPQPAAPAGTVSQQAEQWDRHQAASLPLEDTYDKVTVTVNNIAKDFEKKWKLTRPGDNETWNWLVAFVKMVHNNGFADKLSVLVLKRLTAEERGWESRFETATKWYFEDGAKKLGVNFTLTPLAATNDLVDKVQFDMSPEIRQRYGEERTGALLSLLGRTVAVGRGINRELYYLLAAMVKETQTDYDRVTSLYNRLDHLPTHDTLAFVRDAEELYYKLKDAGHERKERTVVVDTILRRVHDEVRQELTRHGLDLQRDFETFAALQTKLRDLVPERMLNPSKGRTTQPRKPVQERLSTFKRKGKPGTGSQPQAKKPKRGSSRKRDACYNCQQPGHRANECPRPRMCRVCQSTGHMKKDCPKLRSNNSAMLSVVDEQLVLVGTVACGGLNRTIQAIVDTGASLSFISAEEASHFRTVRETEKLEIRTANNETMLTEGRVVLLELHVETQEGRNVMLRVETHVTRNLGATVILGLDAMRDNDLAIEVATATMRIGGKHAVNLETQVYENPTAFIVSGEMVDGRGGGDARELRYTVGPYAGEEQVCMLFDIARTHPDLFSGNRTVTSTVATEVEMTIPVKEGTAPIHKRYYNVPQAYRAPFKEMLDTMEANGIIRKQSSPWGSPSFVIPKPHKPSELRMVTDFRALNEVVVAEPHALPLINEILQQLGGKKVFSVLDVRSGYYTIPVAECDIPKTATTTMFGTYVYLRAPMGLKSTPFIYQRFMEECIPDDLLGVSVFVYLDDTLLCSNDVDEHTQLIETVLKCFEENGCQLNDAKCSFFQDEIHFLGHKINADGIFPDENKVLAIAEMPAPTNVAEVRAFLGLVQYYTRFVDNMAAISRPIRMLLKKGVRFVWGPEQRAAFEQIKTALTSDAVLAHPDWDQPFIVETDGSRHGVGGCLTQVGPDGRERPVLYVSRSTTDAERNYGASELEMLAVVFTLRKLRSMLLGRHFTLRTDHVALTWLFNNRRSCGSGKLDRWALTMQEFDMTVEHRAGTANGNADALSRLPAITEEAASTEARADYQFLYDNLTAGELPSAEVGGENRAAGAVAFVARGGGAAPDEPNDAGDEASETREDVEDVRAAHVAAGHAGVRRTVKTALASYGPITGVYKLARKVIKECDPCARTREYGGERSDNLGAIKAKNPREVVCIDFVGPKKYRHHTYNAFTILDSFSGFGDAVLVSRQTTKAAIRAFQLVTSRWGTPLIVISDRGTQFMTTFRDMLTQRGIEHWPTLGHRPEANGQVERWHKSVQNALKSYIVEDAHEPMSVSLAHAVEAVNTTYSDATGMTPFEAFYGYPPSNHVGLVARAPESVREDVRRRRAAVQSVRQDEVAQNAPGTSIEAEDKVLYRRHKRNKWEPFYDGPYVVTEVNNGQTAVIAGSDGSGKLVHVNDLKLYHGDAELAEHVSGARRPRRDERERSATPSDFTEGSDSDEHSGVGRIGPGTHRHYYYHSESDDDYLPSGSEGEVVPAVEDNSSSDYSEERGSDYSAPEAEVTAAYRVTKQRVSKGTDQYYVEWTEDDGAVRHAWMTAQQLPRRALTAWIARRRQTARGQV